DSGPTINSWESFWSAVGAALKKVWEFLKPVADWFVEIFGQIKEAVVGAFEGMDFNVLLGILNAGALGGLILFFKKIFDLLKNGLNIDFGGGLFASIKTAFGSLTDALAQMQARVKADILIKIAIAVGILAASLVALSLIEPVRLATALGGLAGAFTLLIGSLQVINKTLMKVSSIKLTAIGIAMGLIATAMLILSAAVKVLSSMDWVELSRGLVGLAVGLGLLVAAVKLLPTTAKT